MPNGMEFETPAGFILDTFHNTAGREVRVMAGSVQCSFSVHGRWPNISDWLTFQATRSFGS